MLKSKFALAQLDPDSTDIFQAGLLEHYVQRPDSLEYLCLAEFAGYYTFATKDERKDTSRQLKLKDGSGYLFKRRQVRIISYMNYGLQRDPVNYYREQLMLYMPWRNESLELENIDQKAVYTAMQDTIQATRKQFDCLSSLILDEALQLANMHQEDLEAGAPDPELDPEFMAFGVDDPDFDPFAQIGRGDQSARTVEKQTFQTPHQVSDEEFHTIVSTLNEKQYVYLNHILKSMKSHEKVYEIVSGGAGVGKSRLISAVYQSLLRYYNSIPGNDPNTIKILLCAPTGKAAFQIGGLTLHSSFALPVNQLSSELVPLSADTVNTLHTALLHMKLVIIDEFSMMGAKMFHQVNCRLKQIYKSDADFGGMSVILFGDLRQLAPVGDKWIFAPASNEPYSAICGTYLWDKFRYFELTEVMRQREDKDFAIALNNMAIGEMTNKDVTLIRSREMVGDEVLPELTIHLFRSNDEVDAFNEKKLSEYKTERAVSLALDLVKGSCTERMRRSLLEQAIKLKKAASFGLMHSLPLQVRLLPTIYLN